MVKITLYVEGGGDTRNQQSDCRRGFREFFNKLGIKSSITIIACGSRRNTYDSFCIGLKKIKNNEYCLLLVDSEAPITHSNKWQYVNLRELDKWKQPDNAIEEHLHFMVECMEAWFMADKITLANYYGKEFKQNALPQNSNIENISKQDLLNGLKNATRHTSKGEYSKGGHSFELLSRINASEVIKNSSYAENLCNILKEPEKHLLSH
jgi:hypothetical protein